MIGFHRFEEEECEEKDCLAKRERATAEFPNQWEHFTAHMQTWIWNMSLARLCIPQIKTWPFEYFISKVELRNLMLGCLDAWMLGMKMKNGEWRMKIDFHNVR